MAGEADPKMRVLLADDAADSRLLIGALLKSENITLDLAENGYEATEKAQSTRYDVILMDLEMPVLSGFDAIKAIRVREKKMGSSPVPIIALSAHSEPQEIQRAKDAGCTSYLSKPVRKAALIDALRSLTQVPHTTASQTQSRFPSQSPSAGRAPEGAQSSVDSQLRDLIPGYLANREVDLNSLRSQLAQKEFARMGQIGHRMKGTGAGYGFPQISALGARIEESAALGDEKGLELLIRELEEILSEIKGVTG